MFFVGGVNDDLLFGLDRSGGWRWIGPLLERVPSWVSSFSSFREPTSREFRETERVLATATLNEFEHQTRILTEAVGCVRQRGAGFWYLHDFLITDMHDGPTPPRAEMRRVRRVLVEEAGGTFVDLYDTVRNAVGTAWFNDFVHFSEVGHRRLSDLVCKVASSGQTPMNTNHVRAGPSSTPP